jgi:FkbM family methyltransferase
MNTVTHNFINDLNTVIAVPNDHALYSTFIDRIYSEPYFRKIHSYFFSKDMIDGNVFDAGCWIGDNSIPWSKMTQNLIYAIDPSPRNCSFVKLLAEINNVSNISIHSFGLSRHDTKLSTNYDIDHAPFVYGIEGANTIDAVAIDSMAEKSLIENLSCIHLDVEGMESEVILGGMSTINKYNPIISFEQHIETDNYQGINEMLSKNNYQTFMINEALYGCRHDCRNFIAIPKRLFRDSLIEDINTFCKTSHILLSI